MNLKHICRPCKKQYARRPRYFIQQWVPTAFWLDKRPSESADRKYIITGTFNWMYMFSSLIHAKSDHILKPHRLCGQGFVPGPFVMCWFVWFVLWFVFALASDRQETWLACDNQKIEPVPTSAVIAIAGFGRRYIYIYIFSVCWK